VTVVTPERRIRHYRHAVLLTPREHVAFDTTITQAVANLIGGAAMTVGNTKEIIHLSGVEVGYAPCPNLAFGAQLLETRDDGGELIARDWPVQQIKIDGGGSESSEARIAGLRYSVACHFIRLNLGDYKHSVTLIANGATN
jgi:hypothetical protein